MVLIRSRKAGLIQWKMKDKIHLPITTCVYVVVGTSVFCYSGKKLHLVGVDYLFSLFGLNNNNKNKKQK